MRNAAASLFILGAACVAPGLVPAPAAAEAALDPALQSAVEAWLADDDAASLPVIAERAQGGDVLAQMLVSQIERETPPGAESEFVLGMDRNTRKATFRAKGGLSGTPWVKKRGADGDPMAEALYLSKLPDATIGLAQRLLEGGEAEQAKRLTWEILQRGRFDAVTGLSPTEKLTGELAYLPFLQAWFAGGAQSADQRAWLMDHAGKGAAEGIILVGVLAPLLAPGLEPNEDVTRAIKALRGQAGEVLAKGPEDAAWMGEFLTRSAETEEALHPVASYCKTTCPDEQGVCMLSAIALLDGVDRLMHQDSPYEAAIPQDAYLHSARAEGVLARRLRAAATRNTVVVSGYEVSACLAAVATGG